MGKKASGSGTLIIIGGGEDREGRKRILREVAKRVGKGRLVVTTVASHEPEGYFEQYDRAFRDLGVEDLCEMYLQTRGEASNESMLSLFDGATGVFFSGGDQLRITSQIGDTPVMRRVIEVYEAGGVIAGTSAGASAMCETMLVRGTSRESYRIGDLHMAPGLGLIQDVIIDQHFAQRGRMGRLLGAVSQNPRLLGIGIDEDTAILVEGDQFRVLGDGAVYVVDAEGVTYSNIAEERDDRALSMYDVGLHVLSNGDVFDLPGRRPHLEESEGKPE
ncbi:MAG: cyanophycinase [Fimbriimonas sp.]